MVSGPRADAARITGRDLEPAPGGIAGRHAKSFENDIGRGIMSQSCIEVQHVRLTVDKSFEDLHRGV